MGETTDPPLSFETFENFDFRELPIGVYMTSLDGHFVVANQTLRRMLGLPLEGPLKASIVDYYADAAHRQELIQKALEAEKTGKYLARHPIHFRVAGKDLYVEDYCKALRDNASGKVVGFVGCLVDITDEQETKEREAELRQHIEDLRFDIGRILHANNTTLVMMDQTLNGVIQVLEPNPFDGVAVPLADDVERVLAEYSRGLANVLERFLQVGDEQRRLQALPSASWETLASQLEMLRSYPQTIPDVELHPAALSSLSYTILQICQSIQPGWLPREAQRDLQQAAWQLKRVTVLYDVLKTRDVLLQMEYTLQSLREYVTADVRETYKRTPLKVKYLIDQSIRRLSGYAQSSRVTIEVADVPDVTVMVNEREVVRALSNLLHNAIKYSWRRDRTKPSWVSIRTHVRERQVGIEFENWGVPISKEELEQGLVFQLGYRGQWSRDRGRVGTGIGLTDARHVAESHGGRVLIDSRPTRIFDENSPEYYQQPFLTKVTFVLPVSEILR
jgi:PAS domain S-box-containing protein